MRTHYCTDVSEQQESTCVTICGWVHTKRNLGGLLFLDIRDRSGILQCVCEPENTSVFAIAERLHHEDVVQIQGSVRLRPASMHNRNMKTGAVEICVMEITILNSALPVPLLPDSHQNIHDDIKYRYRYLDLRRESMQYNLMLRHRLIAQIRQYFNERGFIDIETPVLTKATPEGARDYLVPSREYPGNFYALPQSPQLFKQLLMMSGFDKYYQVVKCFRDEDLRADRQPEFTQLDIEMSFIDAEHVIALIEGLLQHVFKSLLDVSVPEKIPRLSYAEVMRRFGSDKPDLRNPLELVDLDSVLQACDFPVFQQALRHDGRVVAIRAPHAAQLSRKQIDTYVAFVAQYGLKGLATMKVHHRDQGAEGVQSSIVKFIAADTIQSILDIVQAQDGDMIFFAAGDAPVVTEAMGAFRTKLGTDLGCIQPGFAFLWVVDWPMFERDPDTQQIKAMHHPFTSPQSLEISALQASPESVLAKAYDIVINGYEIGGGSIRIHSTALQKAVFDVIGITAQEADSKFGFLLEALQYGCPPHGGIALGIDRLVMLMAGLQSIRDVIAFPKTQSAACLLTSAPAQVSPQQLREAGVQLLKKE